MEARRSELIAGRRDVGGGAEREAEEDPDARALAARRLLALRWTVVDVLLEHKQIATLHPWARGADGASDGATEGTAERAQNADAIAIAVEVIDICLREPYG